MSTESTGILSTKQLPHQRSRFHSPDALIKLLEKSGRTYFSFLEDLNMNLVTLDSASILVVGQKKSGLHEITWVMSIAVRADLLSHSESRRKPRLS